MSRLYIVRRPSRMGILLPLPGAPIGTIIPFNEKLEPAELEDLIRGICGKRGLSDKQTEAVVEQAEKAHEERLKVAEASAELSKRIREQEEYSKLRFGGLRPPRKRSQK